MLSPFKIKKPIGASYKLEEEDVLKTKKALSGLGFYKEPKTGATPWPDSKMFEGLKSFQKKEGLKVDGLMKPKGPTERKISQTLSGLENKAKEAGGATLDFMKNYRDMRRANTIGGDKYFHCKANCEASKRGSTGRKAAKTLSGMREWFDRNIKGNTLSESAEDERANRYGRVGSRYMPERSCSEICEKYKPKSLP